MSNAAVLIRCPGCGHGLVDDSDVTEFACPSCGIDFALGPRDPAETWAESPPSVGRFALLERLGAGASGTVWKARDPLLDRLVALKVPRVPDSEATEAGDLLREARSAARLRHPNIVRVHEVGRDGETAYVVSDLVEGITLAERIAAGRLPPRQSALLCAKIARALEHAHAQGVIHRDLKPSNVMLGRDGEPHLLDFGLAKRTSGDATITAKGQIVGTPAYMSPEQARGEAHQVDGRADVYSLGVVLFEMLTGRRPFRGTTMMLLYQRMNEEAPSPRRFHDAVPKDLERVCLKCLRTEPRARYATAGELAEDLERYLAGEPVLARRVGVIGRGWRAARRRPAALASLAAAAVAITVSTYSVVQGRQRDARVEARLVYSELLRDSVRIERIAAAAQSPHYRRAVAEAEKLRAGGRIGPKRSYDLACVYALACGAASRDAEPAEGEREAFVGRCRAASLEMLRLARESGYFDSAARRGHLRQDPDLDVLRAEPAFEDIVRSVMEDGHGS